MSGWQLIAHPEADVCDVALLAVQRTLKQEKVVAKVDSVENIAAAWNSVEANDAAKLDLVVVSSTMPADDSSSIGLSGRDATKKFIKQLKKNKPLLPVIVLASTPDERLADFLDAFEQTGLVTLGSDFSPRLVERIRALRADQAVSEATAPPRTSREDSWIHLDIHLGGQQRGNWQINRVGADEFEQQGTLRVDTRQLERCIRDSKRLDEEVAKQSEEWFERMKDLSSDLRELLFRNGRDNLDCWERFLKHRERVGGVAHSRVRLTVDEETHSMLFEALRDSEDPEDEFWVLNAPVFRRYAQQMALPPLFKEAASRDKPISCLIIEADPQPGVVGEEGFARLTYLQREAEEVEAILRERALGTVERLSLADVEGDLPASVLARLRERQWHVVHFCGHVAGDAGRAGLVMRAEDKGVLPVKALAGALTRTQLLFLSSCRSAATRIVMHAVEQHVSAVVGFQWVIDDRAASEFAADFYRQLFSPGDTHARDLEHALLQARRKAYTRRPEDPSWVAPVLVMQMG
jgi:DNA-binding NarL/FixJ family response regulator